MNVCGKAFEIRRADVPLLPVAAGQMSASLSECLQFPFIKARQRARLMIQIQIKYKYNMGVGQKKGNEEKQWC